jgi:predicted DNA-binding transcriptional regulator AlpA
MRNPERLLSTNEAADLVGLTPKALAHFRRTGQGPTYAKLGRRALYAPNDIAAWVNARKRTRTTEAGGTAP